MELSEIRTRIDAVDDQLLKLFLERMELAEEVAAYKNEHHLPILNKQREREILAKVTAKAGDKERYAYHLYSTLFELARSRQAELVDLPTRVAERVEKSLAAGGPSSRRRALSPVRAWRARTRRSPATACCRAAASCMSRPLTRWCLRWSRACANSACCPLKTAPTARCARSTRCFSSISSPWCAPRDSASAMSFWPCPV